MQIPHTPTSLLLSLIALGAVLVPLAMTLVARRRARYRRRLEEMYDRYEASVS